MKEFPWCNGQDFLFSTMLFCLVQIKISMQEEEATLWSQGLKKNILVEEERECPFLFPWILAELKRALEIWGECFLKKNSIDSDLDLRTCGL